MYRSGGWSIGTGAHSRTTCGAAGNDAHRCLRWRHPEKRIPQILRALAATRFVQPNLKLLLVGATTDHYDPSADAATAGVSDLVTVTGYVPESELPAYLAAADIACCLRWPTAQETSASWLRCLAAGLPTIVTDLAHQSKLPTLDPRNWAVQHGLPTLGIPTPVAVAIDILDEDHSLMLALRRLVTDAALRQQLALAARNQWATQHQLEHMANDYDRVLTAAALRDSPDAALPPHLRPNPLGHAQTLIAPFGLTTRDLDLDPVLMPSTQPSRATSSHSLVWWGTHVVVVLGLVSGVLQVGRSAPYVAPAGHGARLAEASLLIGAEDCTMMVARPPNAQAAWTANIAEVAADSPAARIGLRAGQEVTLARSVTSARSVDLSLLRTAGPGGPAAPVARRILGWVRGPIALDRAAALERHDCASSVRRSGPQASRNPGSCAMADEWRRAFRFSRQRWSCCCCSARAM